MDLGLQLGYWGQLPPPDWVDRAVEAERGADRGDVLRRRVHAGDEPSRIAGDALATLGGPPAPLYSHRELRFAWPHGIRCVSQLAARVACAASDARTADSPLFSGRVRPIYLRDAATTPPRSLSR